MKYLGHIVSGKGVEPEPSKVRDILDWPKPTTVKDLHAFLGLMGFYRKFIRNYAAIAAPLTTLLCKDAFEWSLTSQAAFDALKSAVTTTPVLALPNFAEPFVVETNASGIAMGAVLTQRGHPLAYFSKLFGPRMTHASTYIRELHAIVAAVRKWRQYLLGRSFTILTNHKSLRELMTQIIQTPEQHYYLSKLLGFDYNIQYKAGATNKVADALSQIPSTTGQLMILSIPHLDFIDELRQTLQQSPEFQGLLTKVREEPTTHPDY